MADELVEPADADCIGPDGRPDNALVQQHRLQVDTWKWLLSKTLPKWFGDRVTTEIAGSAAAPLITRMRGNADGPPRPSAAFQPAFASPFRRGGLGCQLDDMMNWLHANCGTGRAAQRRQ